MPVDTNTAVAIARLEERVRSVDEKIGVRVKSIDERLEELLELGRENAVAQKEWNERLVRLETQLEIELQRNAESGERCLELLGKLEDRVLALESKKGDAPDEKNTGPQAQLTAAQVQETKERSRVWRTLSTLFGFFSGALGTWFATKK